MLGAGAGTVALSFIVRRPDKKVAAAACARHGLSFLMFYFLPKTGSVLLVVVNAIGLPLAWDDLGAQWALTEIGRLWRMEIRTTITGCLLGLRCLDQDRKRSVAVSWLPLFLYLFGFVEPRKGGRRLYKPLLPARHSLAFSSCPESLRWLKAGSLMVTLSARSE